MYAKADGPGRIQAFVEEGDPVVITDITGRIVAGPVIAPPLGQQIVIDYDGPPLADCCWAVLNPDGVMAFQSSSIGRLPRFGRVTIDTKDPPTYLTAQDREWLRRIGRVEG
jgi:hypothetical protein